MIDKRKGEYSRLGMEFEKEMEEYLKEEVVGGSGVMNNGKGDKIDDKN